MRKFIFLLTIFSFIAIFGFTTQTYSHTEKPISKPQSHLYSKKTLSTAPRNFTEAKKLAWKIHEKHRRSFYCDCEFNFKGQIQPSTCTYRPLHVNVRTYRVEWDHVLPMQVLGQNRPCWQMKLCIDSAGNRYKGRACCAKIDREFQRMEADLHNLVPAIGTINQARGTLAFGEVKKFTAHFMGCPLKINRSEKIVEPRPEIKGTIARTYLYMSEKYNVVLPPNQRLLYQNWHHSYPPDNWEIEWNRLITDVQGNENPYIEVLQ